MAGLGGAFLMSVTSRYLPEMTAGRGWLAIIIVIAGNWKPVRMIIATLTLRFPRGAAGHINYLRDRPAL